jgi:hypothetical protein
MNQNGMRFVKIKVVVAYLESKICPILNLQGCKWYLSYKTHILCEWCMCKSSFTFTFTCTLRKIHALHISPVQTPTGRCPYLDQHCSSVDVATIANTPIRSADTAQI